MRTTERVTLTLPKETAELLRQRVNSGDAESVSGWVTDLIHNQLREENVQQFLADMAVGGEPMTDEAREWARRVWQSARGE